MKKILLIVGLSGIAAQVLLLRELLISFNGNELILGIILANWMIAEACGVFCAGKIIDRFKPKAEALNALTFLFLFSWLAAVYACRTFKPFLGILNAEAVSLPLTFLTSLVIIFPVSFCHGASFSVGSSFFGSIGNVYVWETIGTILGGVILTYFFIPFFSTFQIVFFVWALSLVIPLLLYRYHPAKSLLINASLFTCLSIFLCLFLGPQKLEGMSLKKQWGKARLLAYNNSVYGNIAAIKRLEQQTFFYNGLPVIITPYPDIARAEELGHIPLLFLPKPQNMLIISNGLGGIINEARKHSLKEIDYAELDPMLIRTVRDHPSQLTRQELSDFRVRIKNLDARLYLKGTSLRYDLILIGLCGPSDLASNRLFTREFFILAKSRLRPAGILALSLPGSLAYLSQELKDLNACILNSLKDTFDYVRVIPGDYNMFIAGGSAEIVKADSGLIAQRLDSAGIKTNILTPDYLKFRLGSSWLAWFNASMRSANKGDNADLKPLAIFKMLIYWNKQFSPRFSRVLDFSQRLNPGAAAVILFLLSTLLFYIFSRSRDPKRLSTVYAIATTGFFGMQVNLLLIFSYQVFYGILYQMIGLLTAVFMAGIATGALYIGKSSHNAKNPERLLLGLESFAVLFTLLLGIAVTSLSGQLEHFVGFFVLLFFLPGLLMGLEFVLAGIIYTDKNRGAGRVSGVLFASDLLGGWAAGVFGAIIFLPVLGFFDTCLITAMLKLSSLLLWALLGLRRSTPC